PLPPSAMLRRTGGQLEGARVDFVKDSAGRLFPAVVLTGRNLTADDPAHPGGPGSHLTDLKVDFLVGGKAYEGEVLTGVIRELANGQQEVLSQTLANGQQVLAV